MLDKNDIKYSLNLILTLTVCNAGIKISINARTIRCNRLSICAITSRTIISCDAAAAALITAVITEISCSVK